MTKPKQLPNNSKKLLGEGILMRKWFFYMPLKAMDKMGVRVNTATGRKGVAKQG